MYERRKKGINPLVLIFIIALVAVCVTLVVLLALGYRYKSTDKGYTFFGKVQSGQPVTGTIKVPGGVTAELDYMNRTITYSNGDVYTGDIEGIYRHGNGKMVFATTGDVYEGSFVDDELTGYGTYTYENGDVYVGYLSGGSQEGAGTYTWASGARYEGAFQNGLANGLGVFVWSDGARYEGDFRDGTKDGQGKFYFSNGDFYEGQFAADRREGEGFYKWANGETYTGTFHANSMDTRLTDEEGNFIPDGDGWKHGEKAVYTWPDGRTYTGYFEAGRIVVVDDTVPPDVSDPADGAQ